MSAAEAWEEQVVRTVHQETIPQRLELPQPAADTEALIKGLTALAVMVVQAVGRLTLLLEVAVSRDKAIKAGMVLMDRLHILVAEAGQVQPEALEVLAESVYQALSLERRHIMQAAAVTVAVVEAQLLPAVTAAEGMAMEATEPQILVVVALAGPLVAGLGARADQASSSFATSPITR